MDGTPLDGEDVLQGWLWKQNPYGTWTKLWCRLTPDHMFYYADKEQTVKKGDVRLAGAKLDDLPNDLQSNSGGDGKRHGFKIDEDKRLKDGGRVCLFDAGTPEALEEWMHTLKAITVDSKQNKVRVPKHETPQPKMELKKAESPSTGNQNEQRDKLTAGDVKDMGKVTEISEGVDFFKKRFGEDFVFEYAVRNRKLANLEFTLDLGGSKNMKCPAWGEDILETFVTVPPDEVVILGAVYPIDPYLDCSVQMSFRWKHVKLKAGDYETVVAEHEEKVASQMQEMTNLGITVGSLRSASAIQQACLDAGVLFTDVDFPPLRSSLFQDDPESDDRPSIVWKRAKDVKRPKDCDLCVFRDVINTTAIHQGCLGDCWFLAALGAVSENQLIFKRIFSRIDGVSDAGVYELICWKNGHETSVIVDDWIPCNPRSGQPCYSYGAQGQLWVVLMEKAWAKLHGTYERIEAGLSHRAMMDFTGDPGWCYNFEEFQPMIETGEFFNMLMVFNDMGYAMCASTPGRDELTKKRGQPKMKGGLVPGHAYSLREVLDLDGIQLVRLRNPWGEYEWDGDWSDKSELWTDELRAKVTYAPQEGDGMFYMSAEDFFNHFEDVGVVYQRRTSTWAEARHNMDFKDHQDGLLAVVDIDVPFESSGYLTLWQLDERLPDAPKNERLAFAVFGPVGDPTSEMRELLRSPAWSLRELVERWEGVQPGKYRVAVWIIGEPESSPDTCPSAVLMVSLSPTSTKQAEEEEGEETAATPALEITKTCLELTPDIRTSLVLASAVGSKEAEEDAYSKLTVFSSWLPHGGFGLAARCDMEEGSLDAKFDMSDCSGLRLVGQVEDEDMLVQVSMTAGEPTKLVCELWPSSESRAVSWGLKWSSRC